MDNQALQPSSSKKKKKGNKKRAWKDLFTDKFIDLVIVIVSILIAYELTNWKTAIDQRSTEKYYLETMLTDLDKDVEEINEILTSLKEDQHKLYNYISRPGSVGDSLAPVILAVMTLETFTDHQNTYQTLVSSNGLTTFSDREIRSSITEYYTMYTPIRRFESIYTNLLFQVNNYFSPYCDYAEQKMTDLSVVSKVQTKNLLLMVNEQLNNGIEDYSDALEKAKVLRRNIAASL